MNRRSQFVIFLIVLASVVTALKYASTGVTQMRPIKELKARITSTMKVPDPVHIESTGDWYYLDHVSSSLVQYDGEKKTFVPMLAQAWEEEGGGVHSFEIKPGIRFHDGTPITSKDILWSIKRHLIFKTATHFPFWEYLVGCENVKNLNDECEGLRATDSKIVLKLKTQTDSFYLQMASPETGIWSAADMNPETGALKATRFSGPYSVFEQSDDSALLIRNENSPLAEKFPDSPRSIRLKRVPLPDLDQAVVRGEIDVAIKQHTPLGEFQWVANKISVHATTPSSMIYLFGLGKAKRPAVGQDLIMALWAQNADPVLTPAHSFLPFAGKFGLAHDEFLAALPEKSARRLRFVVPAGFFSEAFLEQTRLAAKSIGTEIEFFPLKQAEYFPTFSDPAASERYDYVLGIYAASERYPAVQLRYITSSFSVPPIDLKSAESPDQKNVDRAEVFRGYERWLLGSQFAIPVYFDVTLFVHQKNIDIGAQSTSDAEIELWRVRELAP